MIALARLSIIIFLPVHLAGCPTNCKLGCPKNFYISGTVTDGDGSPISDVKIITKGKLEDTPSQRTSTDDEGKFSFERGPAATLGLEMISFEKEGYETKLSEPFQDGTGACSDQHLVRDTILETTPQ